MSNQSQQQKQIPRNSKFGSLVNLRNLGFYPKVVFDVGAQIGTFELYRSFPQSKHILIEPVQENEPHLVKVCEQLEDADFIIAAATSQSGTVEMRVTPNFQYASICTDGGGQTGDRHQRTVPAVSLDDICQERGLFGPYLIKIDVDGEEVEVLKGARQTLKETEYLVIEATLFGQLYDVMDFMRAEGFVAYDIVDHMYRPHDRALWQVDMAFVKEKGRFRQMRSFATPEQAKIMSTRVFHQNTSR